MAMSSLLDIQSAFIPSPVPAKLVLMAWNMLSSRFGNRIAAPAAGSSSRSPSLCERSSQAV